MKKAVSFLVLIMLFFSCKDDAVKKPERLIDKEVMENIIYDLSLLDAIKYNEPATTENYKVNPKEFIFRKYKVDSAQFAQNNIYYASDFEVYKAMYDSVIKRIDRKKTLLDSLVKKEVKRDSLNQAKKKRMDSIANAKKVALAKKDSLKKLKKKDSLLLKKKTITTKKKVLSTNKSVVIKNGKVVN
ncbi:protein of unknown function [Flavobacterium glycines]|uniref:DUF4296 domain-containing protein n=1 Tax=Flavobacterium glycines TaxID=551990 RepID=A0A1B9DSB7_9FLAO|nr:DUF4296 domain-containing protein [Flavobacterium glycines]OCB72586.1 hypothetical protein FBGL_08075 [Flavobacterium glycines]GEL10082.1 hypothetical protein FGL01_08210 [Flavobacterium glycines]SDI82211.1 protein of unknown function [Flavobacterium glycines]